MTILPQSLPEVLLIRPQIHEDGRGYFFEAYRQDLLEASCGHPVRFVQTNESRSSYGVLRGLHFQSSPHAQAKLVRVLAGAILDVTVDIRHGSPRFGQHLAVRLDDVNKEQLFVPRGFAHGFVSLCNNTIVSYMTDNYYSAEHCQGIRPNGEDLGIDWQLAPQDIQLNERDANWPRLAAQPKWFTLDP